MATLFVFDAFSLRTVETITRATPGECEAIAWREFGDDERWGWTFSPALAGGAADDRGQIRAPAAGSDPSPVTSRQEG
jgi:hypothetical protein